MATVRSGPQSRQDPLIWGAPLTCGEAKHRLGRLPNENLVPPPTASREMYFPKFVFRQSRWVAQELCQ
jgi:hypothetical protein